MSKQFTFLDLASVLRVEGGDLFWIARRGSARAGKRAGRSAFAYDAEAVARYGEFARPNFGGAA